MKACGSCNFTAQVSGGAGLRPEISAGQVEIILRAKPPSRQMYLGHYVKGLFPHPCPFWCQSG